MNATPRTFIRVATHTAAATGDTLTHCGMTAPVYQITELPREGERACMLYSLVELPDGALAHPVYYLDDGARRRALSIDGKAVGWAA